MIGKPSHKVRRAAGGTLSLPPKGRGSFEGYMHASATHIDMNGTGYMNPAHQRARAPRSATNLRIPRVNPLSMGIRPGTSLFDMRVGGRVGSSVERLKKQMSIDKMF